MSTIRVSNIQDTSGGNTSTPAAIASGIAKAWVNFNGAGTVAVRASYNVSSIVDIGVGEYRVIFTTAFADANYALVATCGPAPSNGNYSQAMLSSTGAYTTGNAEIYTMRQLSGTPTLTDYSIVNVSIFR